MTNTEQVLPDLFTFRSKFDDTEYTAIANPDGYEVRWKDQEEALGYMFNRYNTSYVQQMVKDGDWTITFVLEANIAIPHVNESVSKDPLLSRIKAYTEVTNSSEFIHDGAYEVYYDGADNPACVDTDEELEKLMNAIVVFDEATKA